MQRFHRHIKSTALGLLTLAALTMCTLSARAAVTRDDHSEIAKYVPVYCWRDSSQTPKSVVVAVHGLSLHGGVFDTMARQLAARGAIVYAPDMRGYGRWLHDESFKQQVKDPQHVDYAQSCLDVLSLVKAAKQANPDLPLYCVGESLGADVILHAASEAPQDIDGLVLSSPAIKHQSFLLPTIASSGPLLTNRPVNLTPFFRRASEDPQVVEGALADPLVRKSLSAYGLLQTCSLIRTSLNYASKVPSDMPVLVIQGSKDRMVCSNAVMLLLQKLHSQDQTVRWFSDRGHLLLETSYVRPETLATLSDWLDGHIKKSPIAKTAQTASGNEVTPTD